MSADGRPNSLLLVVDQLVASWLPIYGHRVVRVPQLSALNELSTVFESAYTPSPLYTPARASLLTGRPPARTGVYDNAAELRASTPTIAHHPRTAGYGTSLAGKMHFVAAVLAGQRDRRIAAAALRRGAYTAWEFHPVADASMQYVRNRGDLCELPCRARLDARPPSTRLSPLARRALQGVGPGNRQEPRRRVSLVGEEEER